MNTTVKASGPVRARFLEKPVAVQKVMRLWLAGRNREPEEREYFAKTHSEVVFEECLRWWEEESGQRIEMSEEELAEEILMRIRTAPEWQELLKVVGVEGTLTFLSEGEAMSVIGAEDYNRDWPVVPKICYLCGGEAKPPVIAWYGLGSEEVEAPPVSFHPACAVEFAIRIFADVWTVEKETGSRLVMRRDERQVMFPVRKEESKL